MLGGANGIGGIGNGAPKGDAVNGGGGIPGGNPGGTLGKLPGGGNIPGGGINGGGAKVPVVAGGINGGGPLLKLNGGVVIVVLEIESSALFLFSELADAFAPPGDIVDDIVPEIFEPLTCTSLVDFISVPFL